MYSIHLAIQAMHVWLYKYARERGLENCLLSNQIFDVSKLPNKNIFIEKLQFIVHQSKFSNSWLKILFQFFLYILLDNCSKADRRNQVVPLTKVLELFLHSLANVKLILRFVFDVFWLYNSYL